VGLANVNIHDNTLRMNGPAWKDLFGDGYANGILLNAQSTLRVENLSIRGASSSNTTPNISSSRRVGRLAIVRGEVLDPGAEEVIQPGEAVLGACSPASPG